MSSQARLNELVDKISQLLPDDIGGVRSDIKKNIRSSLLAGLRDMDLVTREEFDTQTAVLNKTRVLLKDIEARIANIENSQS